MSKHDEALLRFDLGQLPANATIERATLRLYVSGGAGDGTIVCLYHTTLENALPEIPIETIDFISNMTDAAPFLIAITVE